MTTPSVRRRATVSNASADRKAFALVLYLEQNVASVINHALELIGYRTRLIPCRVTPL
jgi:hypothetical protein